MKRKEIKIGLMVVVSLFILIWGFNFMKGRNFFLQSANYYGIYSRVEGLTEGSPIFYRGFKIGSVRKIEFNSKNHNEFVVTFHLTKELPITNRTVAQLYSVGLLDSKAIQLINYGDFNEEGTIDLYPGDTLKTSVLGALLDQVSTEVLPLKDKVENLIVSLDSVLSNIGGIFTYENKENINMAISSFYRTVISLERSVSAIQLNLSSGGNLYESFDNIENFTASLRDQSENLNEITTNLREFSANLNDADISKIVSNIDSVVYNLNFLIEKASSGEGSLGMLMEDNTLYLNLSDAAANLDRLMMDIRHHPDRYVSFSAINIGKKVYLSSDEKLAEEQNIVYKVKVAESKTPLDNLKNKRILNDMNVFEDYDGKKYIYTVGETHSYNSALKLADRLYETYPEAKIIALQNGKPIKLSKAVKKTKS